MFGQTNDPLPFQLMTVGVLAVAAAGAVTDLFRGKIYNWLTFPAMLGGLAASAFFNG